MLLVTLVAHYAVLSDVGRCWRFGWRVSFNLREHRRRVTAAKALIWSGVELFLLELDVPQFLEICSLGLLDLQRYAGIEARSCPSHPVPSR